MEPGRDRERQKGGREMWRHGEVEFGEKERWRGTDGEVVKWRDGEMRRRGGEMERWTHKDSER